MFKKRGISMIRKKLYLILTVILTAAFMLAGCTTPQQDDNTEPNPSTISSEQGTDEAGLITASFSEPLKLDDHVTVTVNDAEIFSSFEETGYTEDDEAIIRKKDFDSGYIFIAIDYTLLYTDENLKGQIIKGKDNYLSINGIFDLYSSETGTQSDNTQKRVWTRFPDTEVVFDYTVVDGGERNTEQYTTWFDVVEGQEFNFKVVYAVRKELLIDSPFYLVVTRVYDSSMHQKYNIDLNLSVEDL